MTGLCHACVIDIVVLKNMFLPQIFWFGRCEVQLQYLAGANVIFAQILISYFVTNYSERINIWFINVA